MSDDPYLEQASAGPFFDTIGAVAKLANAAVLIILVSLVAGEALSRSLFNYSLGFVEEVTGYCVVMLTFFGAAIAMRSGSLFQVHFLYDALPRAGRVWLTRIFVLVALLICGVLIWKTNDLMLSSFSRGKFAPTVLRTPLWIPQLLLPIGFGMIGIFLIEQFLLTTGRSKSKS